MIKVRIKMDFHSRISLVAGKIFVCKSLINKSYPKRLHVISELVVTDNYLPMHVSVEKF